MARAKIPTPTTQTYSEFSTAFDYFNTHLFRGKLPSVLITLKAKPRSFGHYAHGRFVSLADSQTTTDEIAMNPLHFRDRSVEQTLSTLVHEMVHLQQAHFGKPSAGAHHNREWVELMLAVGLHPSSTGAPGGKTTGNKVSHYILPDGRFARACAALLKTGFTLTWGDGGAYDREKNKKQGKRVKYVCQNCKQAAWAKHEAKLFCGACREDQLIHMEPE